MSKLKRYAAFGLNYNNTKGGMRDMFATADCMQDLRGHVAGFLDDGSVFDVVDIIDLTTGCGVRAERPNSPDSELVWFNIDHTSGIKVLGGSTLLQDPPYEHPEPAKTIPESKDTADSKNTCDMPGIAKRYLLKKYDPAGDRWSLEHDYGDNEELARKQYGMLAAQTHGRWKLEVEACPVAPKPELLPDSKNIHDKEPCGDLFEVIMHLDERTKHLNVRMSMPMYDEFFAPVKSKRAARVASQIQEIREKCIIEHGICIVVMSPVMYDGEIV